MWARRWLPGSSLLTGLKLVLGCSACGIRECPVSMLIWRSMPCLRWAGALQQATHQLWALGLEDRSPGAVPTWALLSKNRVMACLGLSLRTGSGPSCFCNMEHTVSNMMVTVANSRCPPCP